MLNPFVKNRQYLGGYAIVWLVVAIVQALFLISYLDVEPEPALADAAVFNLIFAFVGFSLWYILRFNIRNKQGFADQLFSHLATAFGTIAFCIGGSYFVLHLLEADNTQYLNFLYHSLPWRIVTGILLYLILVLVYYFLIYHDDLQQKLKREAELNDLVREAELNALKAQINPHFLFNSLNSISSLTLSNPEKAQEMVIRLSDFMRYSLSYDRKETTTLQRELENAERYLKIEKVRFGKRLRYVCNSDQSCLSQAIPNMILQPLLENAIKHGVYQSVGEVFIQLDCIDGPQFVEIKVSNNYDPSEGGAKGEGLGLNHIRNRLQLSYERADLFEVRPGGSVFEVMIRIPKSQNPQA